MKKLLKPKNVIFIIFTLAIILLLGSVFRYIYLQNIQYQKSNEESVIEQQTETERREEEESLIEKEPLEGEEQTEEADQNFRDDTFMIF